MKKLQLVVLITLFFCAAGIGAHYFFQGGTPTNSPVASAPPTTPASESQSQSQVAFAELTIPYLRERTYQSQLGQFERVADRGTYTEYLTSYDSDGLQINALLTVPTGERPAEGWPAIVFIHGYIPPTQYKTQERYRDYVNYLARNGFVVFKIDLRGHGKSEGQAGGAYYSSDYVIDTLNARAALAASDLVTADRIGLWGHSMAGNVVLRSLAAQPSIPAAVIWAGSVYTYQDFQEYGIDDNSYRRPSDDSPRRRERQQLFEAHGEFSPDNPFWQSVVPTNYLDNVETKLHVHHAQDDAVVSVEYSQNLDRVLDNTDLDHEVFLYQSGGHNLTGSSFTQAMQRTVEFFREHL